MRSALALFVRFKKIFFFLLRDNNFLLTIYSSSLFSSNKKKRSVCKRLQSGASLLIIHQNENLFCSANLLNVGWKGKEKFWPRVNEMGGKNSLSSFSSLTHCTLVKDFKQSELKLNF